MPKPLMDDFGEAMEAQKKTKKILVDVYTDWCGPCKLMDKKTFQNRDVAPIFLNITMP